MTAAWRQFVTLVAKDLRIEARTRQTVGLVTILGVLILAVLGLGLGVGQRVSGPAASAILWVAYLFSGVLCFEKTMAVERQDGALAGLLMAPVDRGLLYAGKLVTNLVLILALATVVTLVGMLFLRFDLSGIARPFIVITALAMLGFAAVGTLFGAAVSSTRLQGGLLALVVFPITLPLVITSTQLMMRMDAGSHFWEQAGGGIGVLVAFDAVYLALSWLVFELLLEP